VYGVLALRQINTFRKVPFAGQFFLDDDICYEFYLFMRQRLPAEHMALGILFWTQICLVHYPDSTLNFSIHNQTNVLHLVFGQKHEIFFDHHYVLCRRRNSNVKYSILSKIGGWKSVLLLLAFSESTQRAFL